MELVWGFRLLTFKTDRLPTFLNMFSFGGDVDVVVLKALRAENLFTLKVAKFKSNNLETALTQFHWLKSHQEMCKNHKM